MEIGEIISDALHYPFAHVKAMCIYIVLCFIIYLISAFTLGGVAAATELQAPSLGIIGIIGLILIIIIGLLTDGFALDIVKLGIERSDAEPELDIVRQIINGIKYLITAIIYFIIPIIVMVLLSGINQTLGSIVGIILLIIFAFAFLIGECRLAKTESLGYALNIGEALKDIKEIGVVKIFAVLIIVAIIAAIVNWIGGLFGTGIIGSIISAIITAYLLFFTSRASGLLYSEVA